jgi:O-acetyl-ADP-ribose deacetylase (regulator of RNase III)
LNKTHSHELLIGKTNLKMQTKINYVRGDATYPQGNGNKIIVHICNDIGAWGKGFVLSISKRWKGPEHSYKAWHRSQTNFTLGQVQFVQVEADTYVVNLIGQRNIRKDKNGVPPIQYDAVRTGLQQVAEFANNHNATIHMPRIGCGLAGGKWEIISSIIEDKFCVQGISVTVYDLL